MRRVHLSAILALTTASVMGAVFLVSSRTSAITALPSLDETPSQTVSLPENAGAVSAPVPESSVVAPTPSFPFTWPIADAKERVTKKHFGLKIEAGHSPVENDRFSGYHVGVDFETLESEKDIDVPIYAICEGKLLFKKFANGYGGLVAQKCQLEGRDVSIMYGHLALSSISAQNGDFLSQGQRIGRLGKGYSEETDGVRKHLHLGIHDGKAIDIRGYVHEQTEVTQWLDALAYLPH